MKRNASAVWTGTLKEGKGKYSTEHGGVKDVPYTWSTRFGDEAGTNPEELIGAAHASCFSMALSAELGKLDALADTIDTKATVTMEKTDAGMSVTGIHLATRVKLAKGDKAILEKAAENAKKGCPISRLLAPGTAITMDAQLA